ncbi:MAG: hypothetical protein ACRDQ4_09420 [Pseudonocardiaceae bacterium]
MTIPQPQYQEPQRQDSQYQEPSPELDSPSAFAPQLSVPPPQFGRLPDIIPLREPAPSQVPQVDTSSRIPQPEPRAGLGARAIIFLIDYVAPVIVLILLLCLGARAGSTAWRLVLAVVGVGLLGCGVWTSGGVWNSGYRRGTTRRSLGARVVRMTEHRKLAP